MQCLPRADGKAVLHELTVFLRGQSFQYFATAVFFVGKEGMTYIFHVHPYLVCAPGLEAALHECDVGEFFKNPPMGYSVLGFRVRLYIFIYAEGGAVGSIASESARDSAFVVRESAPDEGIVGAARGMVEELECKVGLRLRCFSHKKQSAGVLVNTVDESYIGVVDVEVSVVTEVPSKGIEQGVLVVPVPGMNNKSGGLVEDEQAVVLIDNIEWYVLGEDGVVVRLMVKQDLKQVERADFVVAAYGLAIDPDMTGIGSILNAVARGTRHVVCKILVDTQRGLPFVHSASPPLKEFVLFAVVRRVAIYVFVWQHQYQKNSSSSFSFSAVAAFSRLVERRILTACPSSSCSPASGDWL